MSEDDEWDPDDDDAPSLATEEGRDSWIEFLLAQDGDDPETGWLQRQAMVVQEDENMVVRFRYDDGREEIFDLVVRRSMEVVRKDPAGSN